MKIGIIKEGKTPITLGVKYHQFKEGDTLDKISENYEIDLHDLMRYNNIDPINYGWEPRVDDVILLEHVPSATHHRISRLRSLIPLHTYIGYTATPYANMLQDTVSILNPEFGVYLNPGQGYYGSSFFFNA